MPRKKKKKKNPCHPINCKTKRTRRQTSPKRKELRHYTARCHYGDSRLVDRTEEEWRAGRCWVVVVHAFVQWTALRSDVDEKRVEYRSVVSTDLNRGTW